MEEVAVLLPVNRYRLGSAMNVMERSEMFREKIILTFVPCLIRTLSCVVDSYRWENRGISFNCRILSECSVVCASRDFERIIVPRQFGCECALCMYAEVRVAASVHDFKQLNFRHSPRFLSFLAHITESDVPTFNRKVFSRPMPFCAEGSW